MIHVVSLPKGGAEKPRPQCHPTSGHLAFFEAEEEDALCAQHSRPSDNGEYEVAQIQAIGRDANASYVQPWRAGIPLRFCRFNEFLLRLIISLLPRCDADRSPRRS